MASCTRTVEIDAQAHEWATRAAALDRIDVATYIESLVMRDAEYIKTREYVEGVPRSDADPVAERYEPQAVQLAA